MAEHETFDDAVWEELFIDENGNLWDGDGNLIEISQDNEGNVNHVVKVPPPGITQGTLARLDSADFGANFKGLGPPGPGQWGSGTFPQGGGDIGTIETIIKGLRGLKWGSIASNLLSAAPTVYGLWSLRKSNDLQKQSAEGQMELAKTLIDRWDKEYEQSKEFKKTLYSALQQRVGEEAPPALLPGKVPYVNPYRNVIKIGRGPEGSGSPETGPGSGLKDAIRSDFLDRFPGAPDAHYIGQHPGAVGMRPAAFGEAGAGLPPLPEDQSGRRDGGGFDKFFRDAAAVDAARNVDQSGRPDQGGIRQDPRNFGAGPTNPMNLPVPQPHTPGSNVLPRDYRLPPWWTQDMGRDPALEDQSGRLDRDPSQDVRMFPGANGHVPEGTDFTPLDPDELDPLTLWKLRQMEKTGKGSATPRKRRY